MKMIDPVRAAIALLLIGLLAGAGGIWWVSGRNPEAVYRPKTAVGAVPIAAPLDESLFDTTSRTDPTPIEEKYADLFSKDFFASARAFRIDTGVQAEGGAKIEVSAYRLQGILTIEGGVPRAFIDDGTGLATKVVGDTLASTGATEVRIVEIRPDGVVLAAEGFKETVLPLGTTLEEATSTHRWFGGGEGAVLRVH